MYVVLKFFRKGFGENLHDVFRLFDERSKRYTISHAATGIWQSLQAMKFHLLIHVKKLIKF